MIVENILEANGISITKNLIGINYTKGIFIKPKYIVIHDISDNKFKTMREYRNYIAREKDAKESVHYLVGARNIIKILEDDWRGWHVGDKASKEITNSNSISVAMFIRDEKDIQRTLKNVVTLVNKLRAAYNIKIGNVVRHFDVTGRHCPHVLMEDRVWKKFILALKGIEKELKVLAEGKIMEVLSSLNLRKTPNEEGEVVGKIASGTLFDIYEIREDWVKTSLETEDNVIVGYLSREYVEIQKEVKEKKSSSFGTDEEICDEKALEEISKNYKKVAYNPFVELGKLVEENEKKEVPTEVPIKEVVKAEVAATEPKIRKVINSAARVINLSTNLGVRRGPGEENFVVGYLLSAQKVKVLEQFGEWYKIEYQSTIGRRIGYVEAKYITLT